MNFLLGLLVGAFAINALKSVARPVTRGVIKQGILLGRKVQEIQAEMIEDLQDIKAEAESELSEETPPTPHHPAKKKT
jgi:Protein of unknown function (DUF5132)